MHGPALARNPQLADVLLARALGTTVAELPELGAGSIAEFEGVPAGDAGAGGAGSAASAGRTVAGAGIGTGAGAGSPDGREFAAQLTAEVEQLRRERLG